MGMLLGSSVREYRWESVFVAIVISVVQFGSLATPALSQDEASSSRMTEQERAIAERFFAVLKKRPRPGTALDRVYGYHVQNGTLDAFVKQLDVPDSGEQQMILGLLQSQRGKEATAAEAFRRAEKLLPEDAVSSFYLGRSLLAIGQTEQAAVAMERAIERKPMRNEALPIFTELGRIYGRAGQREKALNVWKKLEGLFPGDAKVGGQIARTLAEEGNVEEALQRYESLAKTSRKEEDKIAFAVQAAEMQRRLGKPDEATKSLEQILTRLRPGSWLYSDVRNRIEAGFLKSGDYDALATYYQTKLMENADDLPLQVRLGRILVTAGRLDDAKATLESAVERAPDDTSVRLALIDVLINKADMKGAAAQYEKLAEQDSENPDYLLRWGQVLLEDQTQEVVERRKQASKIWQQLAEARGNDAVTLSQIADRMRSIEQQDAAITLYQKAIEVDPSSPQYREYLGEYLHQLDRKDEAVKTWQSIAEGDRRNRASLVRLAEVFGAFNQPERSIQAWRDASELDLTFGQELRFAKKLRDAKEFDQALERLSIASKIAETPDENEQLLRDSITTYQQAGTLNEQILKLEKEKKSVEQLRKLALMHSAASQLTDAAGVINTALAIEPENVDLLIVAAEIAERQNRFGDAAKQFQILADLQSRYRTNYLQRVAELQMRLGQTDEMMKTCDELIESNPARLDSYQFLATMAFRAGRDDNAITALRRAMNVSPRDNGPREMLAASFADRFRTEEAIELYWQAMRYERETDPKISLAKKLAPLYDRKSDMESLIRRIEELGREDGDSRTTQLMLAAAHESVQDFGAARQAIDSLLAQQPRDVKLLETMVRLCDVADEVALAAEFQQRIVGLADTPENRLKLVQLQLQGELIDVATALSQRISLASDPVRLGGMIRNAAARGDNKTAIAICREAIRLDPSLWDVKLYLAQLLLYDRSDDSQKKQQEAIEIARDLRNEDLAADATPPTRKPPSKSRTGQRPINLGSPQNWSRTTYELQRGHRVGRYSRSSYYSGSGAQLTQPYTYSHARVVCALLEMIAVSKTLNGEKLDQAIEELRRDQYPLAPLNEITDANPIWEFRVISKMASEMMSPAGLKKKAEKEAENSSDGFWPSAFDVTVRLAQLDPDNASSALINLLLQRNLATLTDKESPSVVPAGRLSDEHLELLVDLYEKAKARSNQSTNTSRVSLWSYETVLQYELELANKKEDAKRYTRTPIADDAKFNEISGAISFLLRLKKSEQAEALVKRLVVAARTNNDKQSAGGSTLGAINGLAAGDEAFIKKHRLTLLDAFLARATKARANNRRRTSSLSDGTVQAYVLAPQGYYNSVALKAPLSTELLSQEMVTELLAVMPSSAKKDIRDSSSKLTVPSEIVEHLEKTDAEMPAFEIKTRRVLAAYSHWWDKRPEDCYESLIKLCNDFPDDVELQIERARLASELKQPRVALETLDSFDPLDSKMLVRKEMAAMNLAARIGDVDRAKQAAERLFGMRMDTSTQLALADQLRRLGMDKQASAVLQRLRGGRSRDVSTELTIAQAFLSNDNSEAAAEVAYTVLRRLNSGKQSNGNEDYYRRQAVSVLRSAKKLDALIERSKRRLASSPASTRARTELAELYAAAGQSEEAEKLWEKVAGKMPADPRQMISRAAALYRGKKYKESARMYIEAFVKDPSTLRNSSYEMTRAARQAKIDDEIFTKLLKIDPNAFPYYRVDDLLRLGTSSSEYSNAKRKFIAHIVQSAEVQSNFGYVLRGIPEDEQKKIPEVKAALLDAACAEDAFSPTSILWAVNSYSNDGIGIGSFESITNLISSEPESKKRFIKAAQAAMEDEANLDNALFLLAFLDLKDDDKKDDALATMRRVLDKVAKENDDEPEQAKPGEPSHRLNGCMLWQLGQVLEKTSGIDDKYGLLVDVYQTATEDPSAVQQSNIRYTVKWRLMQAFSRSGDKGRARQFLLEAYASIDNSSQNQHNPGYGDYQDLESFYSTAQALQDAGCYIDALVICNRATNSPEKFEKAKRWGGGTSMKQFQSLAKKLTEKVDAVAAEDYVRWMTERLEKPQANSSRSHARSEEMIKLLDLPVEMVSDETSPSLQTALELAATTESGRKQLQEMAAATAKLSEQESNAKDWSLLAARLSISIVLQSDDATSLFTDLIKRLPTADAKLDPSDAAGRKKYRSLVGLITPMKMALESDDQEIQKIGSSLTTYLKKTSKLIENPDLQLAMARLSGGGSESLKELFASIESTLGAGKSPTKNQTDALLKIAESSAKLGDISLSTRALQIALGQGPPLRQITPITADAFAITRNTSGINSNENADSEMEGLSTQLCGLVDIYSDVTGKQLGARTPKKDAKSTASDNESMKMIYDALRAIVIPDGNTGKIFEYAKPTVSTRGYDRFGDADDSIVVESAAAALTRAAANCEQSDALATFLREHIKDAPDKKVGSALLVKTAAAAKDATSLSQAIKQFSSAMDSSLPNEQAKPLDPLTTITSQMQQDSFNKSQIVNTVMQTLWPIATSEAEYLTPEIRIASTDLLARTVSLINSDSYTMQRHQSVASLIRKRMLVTARASENTQEVERLIKLEIDSVRQQYIGYRGSNGEKYARQSIERLLSRLASDGLTSWLPKHIRDLTLSETRPDLQSTFTPLICLELAKQEPEKRFETLKTIALGEEDDAPIVHRGAFIQYSVPPKTLQRQTPRLQEVLDLPLCSQDINIVDTMLMLADLSAELGHSESLASEIRQRSKDPTDEAAVAAALIELAGHQDTSAGLAAIDETLTAVAEKLTKEKPNKKNSKLTFPNLSFFLAVRAIEAGLPKPRGNAIVQAVSSYASHGGYPSMQSALSRLRANHGLGGAGKVIPGSPLKHFHAFSLPKRYVPNMPGTEPLYHLDDEGFVRGTAGQDLSLLMLRYPIKGSFNFSAAIDSRNRGEADISYGGMIYPPLTWTGKANVGPLGRATGTSFPTPSFKKKSTNIEGVRVTPNQTVGLCNDVPYVTDLTTSAFPWAAVIQRSSQFTSISHIKIEGDVSIPREVSLIDPTMRGWRLVGNGSLPDPMIPIGPNQDKKEILQKRKAAAEALEQDAPANTWSVKANQLLYNSVSNGRRFDPDTHIQYARPLLDGETVEFQFWWETGKSEVHPTIGRTVIELGPEGSRPFWSSSQRDLALNGYKAADKTEPPIEFVAKEQVPKNKDWNTITLSRNNDTIEVKLNSELVLDIPVAESSHPGLFRNRERNAKIRSIKLTGDWPTELPSELMQGK